MTKLRAILHSVHADEPITDPAGLDIDRAVLVFDGFAFEYERLGHVLREATRTRPLCDLIGRYARHHNKMIGSVYAPQKGVASV